MLRIRFTLAKAMSEGGVVSSGTVTTFRAPPLKTLLKSLTKINWLADITVQPG